MFSTFDRGRISFHIVICSIAIRLQFHQVRSFAIKTSIAGSSWPIYITKNEPVSDRFRFQLIPRCPLRNDDRFHLQSSTHLLSTLFSTFPSCRTSPLSIQRRTCPTLRHPTTLSRALSCQCRACLQSRPNYLHPSSSPTQYLKFHNPKLCPFILFHADS